MKCTYDDWTDSEHFWPLCSRKEHLDTNCLTFDQMMEYFTLFLDNILENQSKYSSLFVIFIIIIVDKVILDQFVSNFNL